MCVTKFHIRFEDVDECLVANAECTQLCVNNPGSFECACKDGYILREDGETCSGKFIGCFLIYYQWTQEYFLNL